MKFVQFEMQNPYPAHDERELKKLVDIDKIFAFRESGTTTRPTMKLEAHNCFTFEFNKIEYENKVYDCYNSDDVLHILELIENNRREQ